MQGHTKLVQNMFINKLKIGGNTDGIYWRCFTSYFSHIFYTNNV